ncbi:uncharacterized protein A4U43_C06F5830 [Asparagus officinalis]|uniref:Uncharacterized protein n=1 Tax=Asparagus officinalis TaxID=4686 RepID=A0A5P1EK40_ASPOF|nr:uncharacterized protein A4U43_C06F5830 [Asparagus officinalis]
MALKGSAFVNERGVGRWDSEIFGQGLKCSSKKNVNLVRNLEKGLKGRNGVAFSVLASGVNKETVQNKQDSASLNCHLAQTYNSGNGINFGDGFVEARALLVIE